MKPDHSVGAHHQKSLDIRVIVGNPPYSAGQKSENDNAANASYDTLDKRIAETYVARSAATLHKALYDSYIRAIRWGTDRIGDSGIMAYVTNGGWVEANTADGMRKSLAEEFSSVYVFHLRGNQRTSGETSRREGGKIFGEGSRAPIVITLFVKNPKAEKKGQIFYHDIGDYLSREDKLKIIADFRSLKGITAKKGWQQITPDDHGDWLKQRDDSLSEHIQIGDKKDKSAKVLFENYTQGVLTSRDAWACNFSRTQLLRNMRDTVAFYNAEVAQLVRDGLERVSINRPHIPRPLSSCSIPRR